MPNRIIKESICTSEDIDALSDGAECFFYRLTVNCDDYGLMDARMPIIKAKCYPLKSIDINRIHLFLEELESRGLISLYEVDERPYLRLTSWSKHQQVRAKKAKFPTPEQGKPITCKQLISSDRKCHRNPIQSNPITPTVVGVVRAEIEKSKTGAKTKCPPDFQPDEKAQDWIRSFGVTLEQAAPIILEFRNYWCDRSTLRANWSSAFMRNGKVEGSLVRMRDTNNGRTVPNGGNSSRNQRVLGALRDIAEDAAAARRGGNDLRQVDGEVSPQVDERDRGHGA